MHDFIGHIRSAPHLSFPPACLSIGLSIGLSVCLFSVLSQDGPLTVLPLHVPCAVILPSLLISEAPSTRSSHLSSPPHTCLSSLPRNGMFSSLLPSLPFTPYLFSPPLRPRLSFLCAPRSKLYSPLLPGLQNVNDVLAWVPFRGPPALALSPA